MLTYELPVNEIVRNYYDGPQVHLPRVRSLDFQLAGEWESPMVKLDILIAGEPVDALSIIVHQDHAYERGHALDSKIRELIPRQQFESPSGRHRRQGYLPRNHKPPAQERSRQGYGGDISRKRKLLEKQKEGKKRMKRIGKVDIPQEAFLAVLRVGEESQN